MTVLPRWRVEWLKNTLHKWNKKTAFS